ncbi:MAG: hypothetical protein AAFO81_11385 [Pseudomonadota bacterium]
MKRHTKRTGLLAAGFLLASATTHAQNLAGVFPPGFGPNHESVQYRIAYDPDSFATAHRTHYQRSIDARKMWRIIGQVKKSDGRVFDAEQFTAELFWDLSSPHSFWQHGMRFDATLRTEGRPASIAANWSGQYDRGQRWQWRVNVLNVVQIGDGREGGIFLQSRAQALYRLSAGRSIGIQHYGVYGSTDDLREFQEQGQQLGPFVNVPLKDGWVLFGSVLFGLTDSTADTNLKFWVTRQF